MSQFICWHLLHAIQLQVDRFVVMRESFDLEEKVPECWCTHFLCNGVQVSLSRQRAMRPLPTACSGAGWGHVHASLSVE